MPSPVPGGSDGSHFQPCFLQNHAVGSPQAFSRYLPELCITRVMLCQPDMLILDEATSSIDTRTELKIQNAFAKLMEGRTSFIVAHRLSTIQEADIILESISLSISLLETSFYRPIPAILAKTAFRPISSDCFSFVRLSNTPLYPFSSNGVPFAIRYSFISSHSCPGSRQTTFTEVNC